VRGSLAGIAGVIRNNWPLKLLAVGLAALAVYAISGATSSELTLDDVPVTVSVDEGIAILDQQPKTLRVTFRGSSEDLLRLDRRQTQVVVRPRVSSPDGAEAVRLGPENVRHGAVGVRVFAMEPSRVDLVFDREVRRALPVAKPEITGAPLIGRAEIDYAPQTVFVRGPKRTLDAERFVKTEPVDVEGRAAGFSTRVKVLPPSDLGVSQVDPPEILVRVSLVTETLSREWTNVLVLAVTRDGGGPRAVFDPPAVTVSLHGSAEALGGIAPGGVKAFVDCTDADTARPQERAVVVHVPAGLDVTATVAPARVRVSFVAPPPEERKEQDGERQQGG
jgi:hypothetical protein